MKEEELKKVINGYDKQINHMKQSIDLIERTKKEFQDELNKLVLERIKKEFKLPNK